jgi:RND family efflux transporter MFP subunit
VGCSNDPTNARESVDIKAPIRVNTLAVQVDKTKRMVTLSGFTEPIHRATPSARIMAKIIDARFQEGDRVEGDRVLIHLDTRDLLARKRQAMASLETACTTLEVSRLNLSRMRSLHASQTVSLHQLETSEVAASQAEAARAAAKAAVEDLDVSLSYSQARAPFPGIIVRKMVEVGNMISPGQPLFIIEDDSSLRVIAPVGTDLAAGIKPRDMLTVRIAGQKVTGTVEGIMSSGNTEAPGQRMQLLIDNRDRHFRAGTLAVVEVPSVGSEIKGIYVPKAALIEIGQLKGAYVAGKDKTAQLHWLILGEDRGDTVNVLSGLHDGERVILSPEKCGIRDGSSVEVVTK